MSALPETVYRTPDGWGERVYCQSLDAVAALISELRQLGEDWENISAADFVQLSLREDGRYEYISGWGDGFRVKTVEIVTLTPDDDGTMTVAATESEYRRRGD